MRYDIIKHGRVIGHINIDAMDIPMLKMFWQLGYKIELVVI